MPCSSKDNATKTFAIAVREDVAQQYNLKTTSDLANLAGELNFGGNPDYIERADGFPLLAETYGLEFKSVNDIDIGLKYQALQNGDINVTNAFTTDAQLGNHSVPLVTLEDDKHLQFNYFCSTVVRLAAQPNILLMDEPFGAVDKITRRQLQDEILRLHQERGITILFVTHDIEEALKLGTRVLVMEDGKATQFDSPQCGDVQPRHAFCVPVGSPEPGLCPQAVEGGIIP